MLRDENPEPSPSRARKSRGPGHVEVRLRAPLRGHPLRSGTGRPSGQARASSDEARPASV